MNHSHWLAYFYAFLFNKHISSIMSDSHDIQVIKKSKKLRISLNTLLITVYHIIHQPIHHPHHAITLRIKHHNTHPNPKKSRILVVCLCMMMHLTIRVDQKTCHMCSNMFVHRLALFGSCEMENINMRIFACSCRFRK